ncbi:uncharacterized protein LOC117120573 [Anneissia japonica]|uniref:uncharacterized protein LOC117120573 n=1 Tax=Anneissia japonica TaxID=1529436 RepID=UPI00142570E8|nr:uncharacterized protein LOC117120573 [Anneissia japonica]
MENVTFIVLLLLFVVCGSNCPSTWYAIPENRCIKVIIGPVNLVDVPDSKLCEKYTIGTKVASYFSVTSPNDLAILNNFNPWVLLIYLDWNYVGSNYYYNDGALVKIDDYSLRDHTSSGEGCVGVAVNLSGQYVFVGCYNVDVAYCCEIRL